MNTDKWKSKSFTTNILEHSIFTKNFSSENLVKNCLREQKEKRLWLETEHQKIKEER